MKTFRSKLLRGLIAASVLAGSLGAATASAQENIVALGRVSSSGSLESGTTTVSGVISPVRNGVGDYTVTITAAGAFTGAVAGNFVVQGSIASSVSGDTTLKAVVTAVTANTVTLSVKTDDVEVLATPGAQVAADAAFYFVLYRVPSIFPVTTSPQFFLGGGQIASNGTLTTGLGLPGISMTSSLNATGDYQLTLSDPGGFAADVATDYVLSLTVKGNGTSDRGIRGDVVSVASNDEVVFNIHTDDLQAAVAADAAVAASSDFYFTVHRIPGTIQVGLTTRLLVALAAVADNGTLLSVASSFDGGVLSSIRNSAGDYRITIVSASAFTGRTAAEFVAHATLNQAASSDENIVAEVSIADANTLHIDVNINGVQVSGEGAGVAVDAAFSVVLVDSAELEFVQPDLRIGRTTDLTSMRGNNIYNTSAAGQTTKLALDKLKWSKFYFALEGDGTLPDTVRLTGTGKSRGMNTKYFRISGKRKNITAQMTKGGGVVETPVNPGSIQLYEGWVKYLSPKRRPVSSVNILAQSLADPTKADAVRTIIKSKPWRHGRK